jgi:hypothetical protein
MRPRGERGERERMIFGFNTDIKHENTVYHVQSEARQHDQLLQTQVFVRGRCIGKHANSYADKVSNPDFSDEQMHDLLKAQHKSVIEAIRSGGLEALFGSPEQAATTSTQSFPAVQDAPPAPKTVSELAVEWLNATTAYEQNSIVMRFCVREGGIQVEGAKVTTRLNLSNDAPIYSRALTGSDGTAEMRVLVQESALKDASILVQATHEGRHATRKFRLKRA